MSSCQRWQTLFGQFVCWIAVIAFVFATQQGFGETSNGGPPAGYGAPANQNQNHGRQNQGQHKKGNENETEETSDAEEQTEDEGETVAIASLEAQVTELSTSLTTQIYDIWWLLNQFVRADGTVPFTQPVKGITPVLDEHLATKGYVDSIAAGNIEESDPLFTASAASGIAATDIGNWNTALSWGDHSLAGYLTEESDALFAASAASGVVATDIDNWNTALSWGDHSLAGYLTEESDPLFAASAASG
ncbi:hypothetical protein JXA32_04605, partial [Candidatus Sumerlaeota bacterium]|nr:hypothetical protein [Candidatus Sumerlaeota bacterium]